MSKIPMPMFGRHTTSCLIYPGTVAGDGTVTWGTGVSLAAVTGGVPVGELMGIQFSIDVEAPEVNAMHTTRHNEVPIADGWSAEITIYKVNNGSDPNPLYTVFQGVAGATTYDYIKVVWVTGTNAGSIQTHTFLGHRGAFRDGGQGRGAQESTLSLGPADFGTLQYSVAYT